MLILHSFGPAFGLADPSPFIVKVHILLRMAGLKYQTVPADFKKAPKGKFPVLEDDGVLVPDSTLIRFHIERKYGFDFDAGVSAEARAAAWAFEKLCEDHLYWATVHERWMVDENFDKGPRNFFKKAPALIRPLVVRMIRNKVRKNLHGQGFGRYTAEEQAAIGRRAIEAIALYLGTRAYLGGEVPCGADAAVFATVEGFLNPYFSSAIGDEARKYPALADYAARMKARYFPEMA